MRLTKHHGLANDFLVLLDPDASHPVDAAVARALCDRRTGVGADGLIRAVPPPEAAGGVDTGAPAALMELWNADGSPAEMSGNGIRCLAQALVQGGWVDGPAVPIMTGAGLRTVTFDRQTGPLTHRLSVEMGTARIDGEAPEWAGGALSRVLRVELGNPHLVFEVATTGQPGDTARGPGGAPGAPDTPAPPELVELGVQVNAKVPGGANVHLLTPVDRGCVAIRTYERGVGPTEACGTGACAAAVAAREWGLVGDLVAVDQPGGRAEVAIRGDGSVVLRGPATLVATVELPEDRPWR
jgi:diaminopimelate epimerase